MTMGVRWRGKSVLRGAQPECGSRWADDLGYYCCSNFTPWSKTLIGKSEFGERGVPFHADVGNNHADWQTRIRRA